MSELREWTASEIEEYDDARLELAEDGKIDCTRVYIKSEDDKVIKEKDKEIAKLNDKCQMHDFFWDGCGFVKRGFKNTIAVSEAYDFLESENAQLKESIAVYQRNEKADIRELRHHKYKRCLAMARWCNERIVRIEKDYAFWRYGKDYAQNFYKKWELRWREIAEKFKEAK